MLDRLEVTNFKAWRKLDMQFGKVTGLFGASSSGKSSVLQFLLLLKQTKNATDRGRVLDFGGPNQLVNLGTYEAIVHQGKVTDNIAWTLDWKLPEPLKLEDHRRNAKYEGSRLQLSAQVGLEDSRLSARHMKYRFSDTDFGIEPNAENPSVFELNSAEGRPPFKFRRNRGRPGDLPGPVKTHLFPDQARTYYQNTSLLSDFETEYEALMDRIFYLGPLREYPQRQYGWSGASPDGVGPRGERTVDAILAATAGGEKLKPPGGRRKSTKFQEIVAHWLGELGLIHSFRIEEIKSGTNLYQARVQTHQNSPKQR